MFLIRSIGQVVLNRVEMETLGNYSGIILETTPLFAPKYWYGFGRTFFLNLAVSFLMFQATPQ